MNQPTVEKYTVQKYQVVNDLDFIEETHEADISKQTERIRSYIDSLEKQLEEAKQVGRREVLDEIANSQLRKTELEEAKKQGATDTLELLMEEVEKKRKTVYAEGAGSDVDCIEYDDLKAIVEKLK